MVNHARVRTIVITGGSSGIGKCTATLFAQRGWRVGLIARGIASLTATRDEIATSGGTVYIAQADVADYSSLHSAMATIVTQLGPIDIWVNCAGNGVYGRLVDVTDAEFRRVTDVTYHGTVNGTRLALLHMREQDKGVIINVCSAVAFHGIPLLSSYAGAKAAVRAFGQAMQGELKLARSAVRICTVFPAAMNTPFFSHAVSHMDWPARPVRPVYQPEVAAHGIWQAAFNGRAEMAITGTALAFWWVSRMAPGIIARCVGLLGYDRQQSRTQITYLPHEPTLFAPSLRVDEARGIHGHLARGWSLHLWMGSLISAIKMAFAKFRTPEM